MKRLELILVYKHFSDNHCRGKGNKQANINAKHIIQSHCSCHNRAHKKGNDYLQHPAQNSGLSNIPQLIEVNLRVYESELDNPLEGNAVTANELKRSGIKIISDLNNSPPLNESHGFVSTGNVFIANDMSKNNELNQPKLNNRGHVDKTETLTIRLKEIWGGSELEPLKYNLHLDLERKPTDIFTFQIEEMERLRIVFASSIKENVTFIGWGDDDKTELPTGSTLDKEYGEFSWIPPIGSSGKYIFHFAATDGSHRSQPLRIVLDVIHKNTIQK